MTLPFTSTRIFFDQAITKFERRVVLGSDENIPIFSESHIMQFSWTWYIFLKSTIKLEWKLLHYRTEVSGQGTIRWITVRKYPTAPFRTHSAERRDSTFFTCITVSNFPIRNSTANRCCLGQGALFKFPTSTFSRNPTMYLPTFNIYTAADENNSHRSTQFGFGSYLLLGVCVELLWAI